MQLGLIGLGRMGGNMAVRLTRAGHDVVGASREAATVKSESYAGNQGKVQFV